MSDNWVETKLLYIKILERPPLDEKHLKRPSPKYLFFLIINTLKITGFPYSLFTEQEVTLEHFLKTRENKILFFTKIIGLIEMISNENFEITIDNILKGKECYKTHKFLQYLYNIATSGIDYFKTIEKYLIDNGYDNFFQGINNNNVSRSPKKIVWIDVKEEQEEDGRQKEKGKKNILEKYIEENVEYRFLKKFEISVKKSKDLNDVFNELRFKDFGIIFIIITDTLYSNYYYQMKAFKNVIKSVPITIIYTSPSIQKKIKNHNKIHYFNEEVYSSINDSFYNFGGVSSDLNSCLDLITNFTVTMEKEFNDRKLPRSSFNGCLTFEYVNSLNQLLVPMLYNEILNEETKVADNEVQYFKYLLLNRHGERSIANLVHPLLYVKDMPHEILAKYFARVYTEQTTFYGEMNNSLMKKNVKEYEAFIRIMYEGLANKSLSISEEEYLYRGSYMGKEEFDKIKKKYEDYQKKGNPNLPSFLIYSRCFLSFSKEKNVAKGFLGSNNDKTYAIFFVLKNNEKVFNKYSSNADIETLSAFNEREVLFFPYTSFCLESIQDINEGNKNYIKVELEYIGRYDVALEKFKKNIDIKNEFIEEFVDCFEQQNYSKELMNANIIKSKKIIQNDENSKKNYIFGKFSDKIKEKYDMEVNEKSSGKINEKYKDVFDINEKNKILEKIKIEKKEEIMVMPEIKFELNPKIFYIDLSPSKLFRNIYRGDYNENNQKHGKGIEYTIDGDIIFEGEYDNGQKKEGKEYYLITKKEEKNIINILKYEGNYQNGKYNDGKFYNIENNSTYEAKSGSGFIKEFYDNGCLAFEGELKNGKKDGKWKIYDITGSLIYDGKLINGIKNGKGKEYDENRNLIFEGTFKNGKKMKIDIINRYNELGELVYKKDDEEENILSVKDYRNHIMIKPGIWILEKEEKKIEKPKKLSSLNNSSELSKKRNKIIFKKIKFEEEENDGKNGMVKEYDINNNLIFEGEYLNGKRYNGTYIIKMQEKVYYYIIEQGLIVEKKVEKRNKDDLIYEGDCKDGKGKILNLEGKILFNGEFKNGVKFKGKEFNNFKKLIFNGNYSKGGLISDGEGKEYLDKELVFKGTYKNGYKWEGEIYKEYTKKHILLFDGELKEGYKSKGKEYYKSGKKKFEGLYKDKYYFKGKEYNYDTQLIFDGEYRDKKRWKGEGKEFNIKDKDLIYEGEYQDGERTYGKIKIKKFIRSNKYNILFEGYFRNGKKDKGIEYNKLENYIFEGEYIDGLKYKGKEYYFYKNDTLRFEGQYLNGLRYKGTEYDYGRLIYDGSYKNCKRESGKEYDPETSSLKFSGTYNEGKYWSGDVYDYKGENNSVYNGELNEGKFWTGKAKEYNENNLIIFEGEYNNGDKYKGISYEYDDNMQLIFIYEYNNWTKTIKNEIEYEKDEASGKTLIYKNIKNPRPQKDEEENIEGIDEQIFEDKRILIFEGELKEGKIWNGIGKEVDLEGEIIFEGEFRKGKKWKGKGKEFNSEKELIFEGEINNGKRWNGEGKEYSKKNRLVYDGKYVNGLNDKGLEYDYFEDENKKEENIVDKEYDEDDQIIFEGQIKDGIRIQGKEYQDNEIIYEGNYKDDLRWNGKGIEYDRENQVIFEGEYKEGKYWKGKENYYNSCGALIYKREYNNGLIIKEIEYNIKGKKIFEGEYKNNEKYKGKEYNKFGEIIFEGEYNNNERFEGKAKNNLFDFTYINGKINSKNISVYDYINHELFIGEYKEGEKHNGILRTYFDEINYILQREVEVKEGKINGKGKEYYGNQKLKYEGQYENGKMNGEGILYYRYSGYIYYIGYFKEGKKEGRGKEFDKFGNLIYEGLFIDDKRA